MELWYTEKHSENIKFSLKVKKHIHSSQSKFQKIDIMDTLDYGRILTLDGLIMTTERDEFVYHESIAHIPVSIHPDPRDVLIIGGGDGGTLRELVKHNGLKKITMVEIDRDVIELSRKYLPFLDGGWDHPRAEVIVMNGFEFLKDKKNCYDLVIVDSTDPIGPGIILFEDPFYSLVKNSLRNFGIMVQQTESFWYHPEIISKVNRKLSNNFESVHFFSAPIPSYPSGYWNFSFCTTEKLPSPWEKINSSRIKAIENLKFLNPEIAKAAFALPNFALNTLKK